MKGKNLKLRDIIDKFAKENSIYFSLSIITAVISGFLSILPFLITYYLLREFLISNFSMDFSQVKKYAMWILTTQLISIFGNFLSLWFSHKLAFCVESNIRLFGMKRLMELPLGFFEGEDTGRLRRQIDDEAGKTHTYLAHNLPDFARGLSVFLSFFAVMLLVDLKLSIVNLGAMIFTSIIMASMMSGEIKENMKNYVIAGENLSITGTEYIRGIPIVKIFQQSVESFQNFYKAIMDYDKVGKVIVFGFRNKMILAILVLALPSLVLGPVTLMLMKTNSNPGLILSKGLLMILLSYLMMNQFMLVMKIQESKEQYLQALSGIMRLYDEKTLEMYPSEIKREGGIVFEEVSFSYPGRENLAVKNFSFHFKPGLSYALVGPSGSGKSTIIKLIARLYDADEGSIFVEGRDVRSYSESELYDKMAVVFQENSLLSESLRENVTMGYSASDEEITEALKDAACLDILERVGLDGELGKEGTYLSGGEKQRVNIARATLRKRPILLLDEASAYADAKNEREITKSLEKIKKVSTTISIAHRLTSIVDSDCILVLENGELKEFGNHKELMKNSEIYSRLVREYDRSAKWSLEVERA